MASYETRRLASDDSLAGAHAVRRAVFVEEQGVPEAIEMDDKDAEAVHFVVRDTDADRAVGTARLRVLDADTGKAERVAVLSSHRGEGLGEHLMGTLERAARDRNLSEMMLHAQLSVEAFYRKLGYETVGDEFEEAGIPHVEMRKRL